MTLKRTLASAAVAVIGAGSLVFAAPAQAAPSTSNSVNCDVDVFGSKFAMGWAPTLKASSAVTADGKTQVALSFSDLDGSKLPVPMEDFPVTGAISATINGKAVTFEGSTRVTGAAAQPVPVPEVFATVDEVLTDADVIITSAVWTIKTTGFGDFAVNCPPTGAISWELPTIAVTGGAIVVPPSPSPTPSSTPTPTPSSTPTPTPSEEPTETPAQKGVPAKGSVVFDCMLSAPFNTPFDYEADVVVDGMRPTADSTDVSLAASFTQIPGLAPVPITGGKMRIIVKGDVEGEAFELTGSSVVNVGENEPVPVPQLSASVDTDAEEAEITMDSFRFEFDPMDNLEISADCTFKSGEISAMTIGVGELEEEDTPEENGGSGGDTGAGGDSTTTLPRTGGADAMPVIALWAGALGVAGAGLLVWLPRQRRATN